VPVPGGIHKTNNSGSLSLAHSGGGGGVDTDLNIDQSTGEIRSAVPLDREQRSYYSFIAIPLTGANIKVTIVCILLFCFKFYKFLVNPNSNQQIIEDVNDNSPQFPTDEIDLEFPENSKPRDVKRTLPPARDIDLGINN
jgi:protocadherin-16/23